MADIPSVIQKLNDVEINSDEVVSEQLFTKIGGSINGLIDRTATLGWTYVDFTTSGSWVCPAGIKQVTIEACGGGSSGATDNGLSGQGGFAATPVLATIQVIPGATYSVTIGAGGAQTATGVAGRTANAGQNTVFARAGKNLVVAPGRAGFVSPNGYEGNGAAGTINSPFLADFLTIFTDGVTSSNGGRGGQAGPYGNGANGNDNEGIAAVANSGAGGGGSGDASPDGTDFGGAGGSGRLIISYFG